MDDVACYAPKTGPCDRDADCVYGTVCTGGRCGLPAPAGLGQPCSPANQQACVTPAAVCTGYDDPAAPAGTHCALPPNRACAADAECIGYHCGWVDPARVEGTERRRAARAAAGPPRPACCGPAGSACSTDRDCCMGETCAAGACAPCPLAATHEFDVPMPGSVGGNDPAIGIAFLPDGRMLVSNGASSNVGRYVYVFTDVPGTGWVRTGQFTNRAGGGGSNFGLAVAADGTVHVAQASQQIVSIWRETDAGWEQVGQIGDGSGTDMSFPFSVALLPDGRVVVGEGDGYRVSVWQGGGNAWTRVAQFAHVDGSYVWAVAAAPDGEVYVLRTDYVTDCSLTVWRETAGEWVQVDTVGSPVCGVDWGWFGYGVLLYGPYVMVADEEVSVWSRESGGWVRRLQFGFPDAATPDAPDALNFPYQIAAGPGGLISVADSSKERVSVWNVACAAV